MYNGFSLLKEYTAPMNPISFEDEEENTNVGGILDDAEDDEMIECTESLQLGLNGYDYTLEASYIDYIESKIINENRLINAIERNLILTESSSYETKKMKLSALNESGLGDKIKAKWNKFIKFIKNIFAKFMESMSNILYREQDYLKKYQKIILNKRPKEDIEYSYTGNYKVGINRITTLEVPDFNYATMKTDLLNENDDNHNKFIRNFIKPIGYDYDDVESLADSFKKYFIAGEEGSQSGKLSDINMTDLYNFCFNYDKIQKITSKDITHLEKSTNAIIAAAQENRNNADQAAQNNNGANPSQPVTPQNNSAAIFNGEYFTESNKNRRRSNGNAPQQSQDTGNDPKPSTEENKSSGKAGDTNLTLDVSRASGSIKNDQGAKEDKDAYAKNQASNVDNTDEGTNDLDKCITNYMSVCRTIITAKWTAAEQIAKDYMAIIRAHVRSYVGNDKDTADNVSTKKGTKYTIRDNNNNNDNNDQGKSAEEIAKEAKENAEKEANK